MALHTWHLERLSQISSINPFQATSYSIRAGYFHISFFLSLFDTFFPSFPYIIFIWSLQLEDFYSVISKLWALWPWPIAFTIRRHSITVQQKSRSTNTFLFLLTQCTRTSIGPYTASHKIIPQQASSHHELWC